MKCICLKFLILPLLSLAATSSLHAQLVLDVEGNYIVSLPYNVVRIPASGGTQFDLANDLNVETRFAYRLRAGVLIAKRHEISVLYAPLTIKSSGSIPREITYNNQTFAANLPLNGIYKFNSYRITYRYSFVNSEKWRLAIGISGKVRDANISMQSAALYADYPDLGFVPLINFFASYRLVKPLKIVIEGDALGTGKGRAEDIFAGVYASISKSVALKAGYRLLEGGANVERNYNFTWVNYAAAGVVVSL